MFDHLPPFLTVEEAARVLRIGRSKAYELTVEWERSGGKSGLPFIRLGHQKRVPREAIAWFVRNCLAPTAG
jgi:excisionase family DNA binding protein